MYSYTAGLLILSAILSQFFTESGKLMGALLDLYQLCVWVFTAQYF